MNSRFGEKYLKRAVGIQTGEEIENIRRERERLDAKMCM